MAARDADFQMLRSKGYAEEVYKGLVIFTFDDGRAFYLKIYRDSAAHPIRNEYYRQAENRAAAIESAKRSYDYWLDRKAKAKANPIMSTAANAASAIRAELKKKFPNIKFSVRSENYSGGNSVRVGWVDGPSQDEVKSLVSKYQQGHFNGMEDIYEYSNSREDIPQVKYVFANRDMSDEARAAIEASAEEIFGERDPSNNEVYRIWRKASLPAGAKVIGLVRSGENGSIEDVYRVAYELPGNSAPDGEESPSYEKVEVPAGEIQVIDYSERAFAVIGDTKPIKEELKALGGKFNARLSCGPGWIFSKKNLEKVQQALNDLA